MGVMQGGKGKIIQGKRGGGTKKVQRCKVGFDIILLEFGDDMNDYLSRNPTEVFTAALLDAGLLRLHPVQSSSPSETSQQL